MTSDMSSNPHGVRWDNVITSDYNVGNCEQIWSQVALSHCNTRKSPEGKFTDDDPWQRSKSVRYGSHPVRCLTRWMNFQMYVSTGMNFPKATDGWISSATLRKVALRASKKLDRFTKSMEQSTVSPWPHILFRSLKCSFERGDPNCPLNQILLRCWQPERSNVTLCEWRHET